MRIDLITLKDEVYQVDLKFKKTSHKWFKDLFADELGSLPVTYHMKLDLNVNHVVCPPHRVLVALIEKSKNRVREHGETRGHHTHLRAQGMGLFNGGNTKKTMMEIVYVLIKETVVEI